MVPASGHTAHSIIFAWFNQQWQVYNVHLQVRSSERKKVEQHSQLDLTENKVSWCELREGFTLLPSIPKWKIVIPFFSINSLFASG
jgi:hypothetical protein